MLDGDKLIAELKEKADRSKRLKSYLNALLLPIFDSQGNKN